MGNAASTPGQLEVRFSSRFLNLLPTLRRISALVERGDLAEAASA
jgi:hypothetical protein